MKIYVVYRCLYGEDFIQPSINSIKDVADKIFVFWDNKPWGDIDSCTYLGKRVIFPEKFDNIIDKIKELGNPKVILKHDHVYNNLNQFTHFVNDLVLPYYECPDLILVMEIDHVFRQDQLSNTLKEMIEKGYVNASTRQVEVWKNFKHRVPEREYRTGAVLWNMNKIDRLPETFRQAESKDIQRLASYVHNFGFAFSEKVMYWKHMLALGFSEKIGDGQPNERWLEKWRNWKPGDRNLEISTGYEHLIPEVVPYPSEELPEEILKEKGLCK